MQVINLIASIFWSTMLAIVFAFSSSFSLKEIYK